MLTKVDLVPADEVGAIKNRLSKVATTLTFREGDESFLNKLKKALLDGAKLAKFEKTQESKLIGVFGYAFVGKETFLDRLQKLTGAREDKDSESEAMEDDEEEGEEEGEEDMEEDKEEEDEEEEEEISDIIIGHGFSIIKLPANTIQKEHAEDSLMMQSGFRPSDLKTKARKLVATLLNEEVCKRKELCRAFRIPNKFTDADSLLKIIGSKMGKQ